jgi:hypothetical protein
MEKSMKLRLIFICFILGFLINACKKDETTTAVATPASTTMQDIPEIKDDLNVGAYVEKYATKDLAPQYEKTEAQKVRIALRMNLLQITTDKITQDKMIIAPLVISFLNPTNQANAQIVEKMEYRYLVLIQKKDSKEFIKVYDSGPKPVSLDELAKF